MNDTAEGLLSGAADKTIGLIIPDSSNPFYARLRDRIVYLTRDFDFVLKSYCADRSPEKERILVKSLCDTGARGLLLCTSSTDDVEQVLENVSFPITLIDRVSGEFDYVTSDHYRGGEILAGYAMECGVRSVALLESDTENNCTRSRREGFLNKIRNNIPLAWRKHVNPEEEIFLGAPMNETDLIMCSNDRLAIRAISELSQCGLSVPDDVSILGFDDIPESSTVCPRLTTIKQDVDEIALGAVETLLRRLENPQAVKRSLIFEVEIVVRNSVKKILH